MKIAAVRAIPLEAPLDSKIQVTAFGPRDKAQLVMVEIETDDGIVGYGEALARYSLRSYVTVIEDLMKPILLNQDPFDVEDLWQKMFRVFKGKAGGVLLEAIAACDIALWDIIGKACKQSLHRILGANGRSHIRSYASSISWGEDRVAIAQTEQAVKDGFLSIKIKIGPPVERALARAALIRKTAGDGIELMADANWGFDFDDSIRLGHGLADLNFAWLEEPITPEDVEGYIRLRPVLPIRLAAGEGEHTVFGCRTLLASGGVGVIQPDPARAGGITEARRIGVVAYAFNIPFAPHVGFCGAICAAAGIQLSASLPNFMTYEAMIFDNILRRELTTTDVTDARSLKNGCLPVPTGAGLGIEINREIVERFRVDR
jgi:L-alanine-DL-glutamate epimerase-like enolase superfamily enzyme